MFSFKNSIDLIFNFSASLQIEFLKIWTNFFLSNFCKPGYRFNENSFVGLDVILHLLLVLFHRVNITWSHFGPKCLGHKRKIRFTHDSKHEDSMIWWISLFPIYSFFVDARIASVFYDTHLSTIRCNGAT